MSKPKDDLISRAAALNAIDCWHIDFNSMDGAKVQTDCWRTIKELPAVNAVPVIRCRDCKYSDVIYDTTSDTMPLKCLNIRYGGVMPDWYCEHGERRESE